MYWGGLTFCQILYVKRFFLLLCKPTYGLSEILLFLSLNPLDWIPDLGPLQRVSLTVRKFDLRLPTDPFLPLIKSGILVILVRVFTLSRPVFVCKLSTSHNSLEPLVSFPTVLCSNLLIRLRSRVSWNTSYSS